MGWGGSGEHISKVKRLQIIPMAYPPNEKDH